METTVERATGRSLVTERLFDRLVCGVVADERHDQAFAVRVVDQALAFLGACARHHGEPLSPSRLVDTGWHVFVLHTREYREFCRRVAGRFIDHVPTNDPCARSGQHATALRRTVATILAAGYTVDMKLWFSGGNVDCTGCHNGCHDDPPPAYGRC